jgi:IS605 OrfB family transposase
MRKAQKRGKLSKGWAKRRAWADEAVHVTANRLVDLALKHDAQLVLEELKNLSAIRRRKRVPGTRRGGFNTLLNRVQYEKLKNVLIYKLGEHGLPKPVEVHAAGTSMTCPECGVMDRENRPKKQTDDGFDMAAFKCISCGHEADADENAARIIALKGRWLKSLPKKSDRSSGPLPDTLKFEAFLRDCADKRMGVQRS